MRLVLILGSLSSLAFISVTLDAASASLRGAHRATLTPRKTRSAHARAPRGRGYPVAPRASTSIVGGTDAHAADWGFMARVLYAPSHTPEFYCGGTLVAANVILTAAHCVTADSGAPLQPQDFQVTTGSVDLSVQEADQVSAVSRIIVHPGYDPTDYAGDAALLVLTSPSTAPAVRLARAVDAALYDAGRSAQIAGWGDSGDGDASSILQVAGTNVRGADYCSQFSPWYQAESDTVTCAANDGTEPTGTCFGDSGGPLLSWDTAGNAVEIGLTSVGPRSCDYTTGQPDYFTRTDVIAGWVNDVIASVNGRSTSGSTPGSGGSTSTTTTTSATTSTTTTKPALRKPPVVIAKVALPRLTMASTRSYAATMVRAHTHKRPRLALSCRRVNPWSAHCSIRWHAGGSSYSVSGRFFHYLQGTRAYWWYDFTGTRRWKTCRVRGHQRACMAYVERFRWS